MRAAWVAMMAVAVVFTSGCPRSSDWIERTLVTSDVTGVWEGPAVFTDARSSFRAEFVLQQQGAKVTGEIKFGNPSVLGGSAEGAVRIQGTVSGDTFTFYEVSGPKTDGEFQVSGDEMIGWFNRFNSWRATLHRRQ